MRLSGEDHHPLYAPYPPNQELYSWVLVGCVDLVGSGGWGGLGRAWELESGVESRKSGVGGYIG